MECLYAPALEPETQALTLPDDEAQHARALRLRTGDEVMLTNGRGLCAAAVIEDCTKQVVRCGIRRILPEHNEHSYRIIVALGILDNRERMEFALEKAIELGATDFVPLLAHHSERDRTRTERLTAKALAAMKQAHRARRITLHTPMLPSALVQMLPPGTAMILADVGGEPPAAYSAQSVCVCVGPEGGFSAEEQALFRHHSLVYLWKLAPTRLRAETALVVGLSALTLFHQQDA